MKPYPNTKPSGVQWLGEVPEHWDVKAIKWETPVFRGASPRPIDDPVYFDDEGEFAWVRIADVTAAGDYLESTTQQLSRLGSSLSVKLRPGALFLSIAGTVGKPCITKIKCCIHDGFVYFPGFGGETKFLFYVFASGEPYRGLGKLGTQLNLNTDTVGSIIMGFPPPEEQTAIAAYLDRETGRIDELVGKKRDLIERLKEKRSALISRTVTRGLPADLPPATLAKLEALAGQKLPLNPLLKPSGIDWLGDVPEHWEVLPIKHLLSAILDTEHKTCPYYDDGEFLVARTPNIRDGKLNLEGAKYTDADGYREWTARGQPKPGDILFTREAPAGEACIVPSEPRLCIGQRVVLFRTDLKRLESQFAIYSLYGGAARIFIQMHSLGSTVAHFNMSEIAMIPMLVPPLPEQRAIAAYLDEETAKLDALVAKVETAIERLQEYRTALITAAVTGKIDVRNDEFAQ